MKKISTFEEFVTESIQSNDFKIGKVSKYFEDVWTKGAGTKREFVNIKDAKESYGFIVGSKAFFVDGNKVSKIGTKEVYRAVEEDNKDFIIYVDKQGNLYSDTKGEVDALRKLLK